MGLNTGFVMTEQALFMVIVLFHFSTAIFGGIFIEGGVGMAGLLLGGFRKGLLRADTGLRGADFGAVVGLNMGLIMTHRGLHRG